MKRHSFFPLLFTALLVSLIAFSGCGSSGGGGGNRNGDLLGSYLFHQIGIDSSGTLQTSQVELTIDGDGSGSFNILRHSDGTTGSGAFSYTVNIDHTMSVDNGAGTDNGLLSGDNALFLLVDAEYGAGDTDSASMVGIGMRKDCLSPPLLSGDYRLGQIGLNTTPAVPVIETKLVDVTITTPGNGNFSIIEDSGGAAGANGDFTYSVGADCTLTVNNGVADDFGIVSADGSRFVLVDADQADADNEIILLVGIQKAANGGDSHFAGNYWLGQAGVNGALGAGLHTARLDLTAAGDGTGSVAPVANSLTPTPGPTVAITYSINGSDGTATLNDGVRTASGMIDAAGELIFSVDTDPGDGTINLNPGLLY